MEPSVLTTMVGSTIPILDGFMPIPMARVVCGFGCKIKAGSGQRMERTLTFGRIQMEVGSTCSDQGMEKYFFRNGVVLSQQANLELSGLL